MCCILTSSKSYIILPPPLPYNGGHESYTFIMSLHGHYYYIVSLFYLCPGVEKKIFKKIMQFYCMTYGHAQVQEGGGHEI